MNTSMHGRRKGGKELKMMQEDQNQKANAQMKLKNES
jgi:hypothetical protein